MNLTNQFLISMPHLQDGIFSKSVVLICEHNKDGAIGIVINKSSGISLELLFERIGLKLKRSDLLQHEVNLGGPVQIERGFVLHEKIVPQHSDAAENFHASNSPVYVASIGVKDELELTSSFDVLEIISMGAGPKNVFFTLGCSSWDAGQLENEIIANSWLVAPASKQLIFETPLAERYQQALATLGIREEQLISAAGKA